MSVSRIDLHALGGVAGDMFAAAAFDAYPDLYQSFITDLSTLAIDGLEANLATRMAKGFSAKHFTVVQATAEKPPRTLTAVQNFLSSSSLEAGVAQVAISIYSLLAQAEAAVHGKTIDTIHFHEVSDWDSMVDVIAAAGVIARLDCPHWRLSPLPLGGGTITTAHGDIPLPAPATLQLLQGYDWIDDGQPGERVTPTGAAIVAHLSPQPMTVSGAAAALSAVGVGCGSRELADRANILRFTAFESAGSCTTVDEVTARLAFEIDDMTGEELARSMDSLRDSTGVIDVAGIAMQGKKGRHSVGVRVLVVPDQKQLIIDQCFQLFSTLGIRHTTVQRCTLQRVSETIDKVRVKSVRRPQGGVTAKAESDDLAACDTLAGRRHLATRAEQIVVKKATQTDTDNAGTDKP